MYKVIDFVSNTHGFKWIGYKYHHNISCLPSFLLKGLAAPDTQVALIWVNDSNIVYKSLVLYE